MNLAEIKENEKNFLIFMKIHCELKTIQEYEKCIEFSRFEMNLEKF